MTVQTQTNTTTLKDAPLYRILHGKKQLGIRDRGQLLRFADIPAKKLFKLRREGKTNSQIAAILNVKEDDVRLRLIDIMTGRGLHHNQRTSLAH